MSWYELPTKNTGAVVGGAVGAAAGGAAGTVFGGPAGGMAGHVVGGLAGAALGNYTQQKVWEPYLGHSGLMASNLMKNGKMGSGGGGGGGSLSDILTGKNNSQVTPPKDPFTISKPVMDPNVSSPTMQVPVQGPNGVTLANVPATQAAQNQFNVNSAYGIAGNQNQNALMAQLAQQAQGKGPSLAAMQLQQGQQNNLAATMAQLASSRGQANPLMQRQALQAGNDMQATTNQQAAQARIQEQMQAQGLLGQVSSQAVNQGLQQRQQDIGIASQNAGLSQEANLENYRGQLQTALAQGQINAQQANQLFAAQQSAGQLNTQEAAQFNDLKFKYAQMGMSADEANQQAQLTLNQQRINQSLGQAGINQQNIAGQRQLAGSVITGGAGIAAGYASKPDTAPTATPPAADATESSGVAASTADSADAATPAHGGYVPKAAHGGLIYADTPDDDTPERPAPVTGGYAHGGAVQGYCAGGYPMAAFGGLAMHKGSLASTNPFRSHHATSLMSVSNPIPPPAFAGGGLVDRAKSLVDWNDNNSTWQNVKDVFSDHNTLAKFREQQTGLHEVSHGTDDNGDYYANYSDVPKSFKSGGKVPGKAKFPGDNTGNDTVLARLSPGEVVLPRTVVDAADPVAAFKEFMKTVHKRPIVAKNAQSLVQQHMKKAK